MQVGRARVQPERPGGRRRARQVRMTAATAPHAVLPEAIALEVVHEDRGRAGHRQAGGSGGASGGRQSAAIRCRTRCWACDPALAALPRAGIIHRLDKDTSGLLVVARTLEAHTALTRQLMARSVSREYLAVCVGVMTGGGTIEEPIGRHRSDRLRMAVRQDGRPADDALSRCSSAFAPILMSSVRLETGRTHQIRLHLSHLELPDRR